MPNKALYLTRDESQTLDREAMEKFVIPSIILMENAGRSAVDFFLPHYHGGTVVICCGKGNNGGDGLVVARHLDNHGIPVQVLVLASPHQLTVDAQTNYRIAVNSGINIDCCLAEESNFAQKITDQFTQAAWIIDAIFGTGLTGNLKFPYDHVIRAMNESSANVLSLDIPSGLDCDTGKPLGIAVQADYTVTFAAMKKGFMHSDAQPYLGNVHIADIGIPRQLLDSWHDRSITNI